MSGGDGGEGMEPTPNYDCHVAQYQPRPCDPIHLQLARSQVNRSTLLFRTNLIKMVELCYYDYWFACNVRKYGGPALW